MTTTKYGEAEARVSISGFNILIHEADEGESGYWGEVLEMPGCLSQGETLDELKVNMQEAIEAVLYHSRARTPDSPSYFKTWPTTSTGTA